MPPGVGAGESQTDRGVSRVVVVMLMVVVVFVLAAVAGGFVFVIGDEAEKPAPTVSAEFDRGEGSFSDRNKRISITHEAGDNIPVSELRLITEVECFDDALLVEKTKRGELVNLTASSPGIGDENVNGDEIFQRGGGAEAPLVGGDGTWTAGKRLVFEIDDDECGVEPNSQVDVQVVHEPSDAIIFNESSQTGFTPAPLEDSIEPTTPGTESTHTWGLNLEAGDYGEAGNDGDEVDEITVDYEDASFGGLTNEDITVTMTRTFSGGLDRSEISVNSGTYFGDNATFDLSGFFQTDVAGPIEIEIDGIENPNDPGEYDVTVTLDGDAGELERSKTLEIED